MGSGRIWRSSWSASAEPIFPRGRAPNTSPPGFRWLRVTRSPGERSCPPQRDAAITALHRYCGFFGGAGVRLWAVTVGRTETALGAFFRRLSARIGKAKAITATARKIAVLFYNALRHGMKYTDPGAAYYEERYRQRVLFNLQRRAKAFGYVLQAAAPQAPQAVGVS